MPSIAEQKNSDRTNATAEQTKAFWRDDSIWKTSDGREKWIDDLELLVDGLPVGPEWEPFDLQPEQTIVILGSGIRANALRDDGVSLVQALSPGKMLKKSTTDNYLGKAALATFFLIFKELNNDTMISGTICFWRSLCSQQDV